ncbi:MAG: hypothetical protein SF066_01515 [Thermoanaerobaculia bacterium]|nr:hypothetical protein [Thermoanaerobaculia bacterium]
MHIPEKRSRVVKVAELVFGLTLAVSASTTLAEQPLTDPNLSDTCAVEADINRPKVGCDVGLGLTVIDRAHDQESFRFDNSTFVYTSVSNLRTEHFRVVAQLAVLDWYDDIDFETGVGLGMLWRPNGEESPNALGIAAGAGYNLMADESDEGWYAFVGFSWNFNRKVAAEQAKKSPSENP